MICPTTNRIREQPCFLYPTLMGFPHSDQAGIKGTYKTKDNRGFDKKGCRCICSQDDSQCWSRSSSVISVINFREDSSILGAQSLEAANEGPHNQLLWSAFGSLDEKGPACGLLQGIISYRFCFSFSWCCKLCIPRDPSWNPPGRGVELCPQRKLDSSAYTGYAVEVER